MPNRQPIPIQEGGLAASKVVVTDSSCRLTSGTNTNTEIAAAVSATHAPITLKTGHDAALSISGQELDLADVLTPTEHTAIGNGAPHHAVVTIGADGEHSLATQVLSGVDAAAAQKGHIQLAGELGGTAASPTVAATHSGSAHHAAVSVSAPISVTGQALSIVNDAAATITEVDTGVLASSDTVIPTSKAVVTAIAAAGGHAAVTVSAPLSVTGQALSIVNDAAATITEVDTGVLADSDTVIPTSKAVKTAISAAGGGGFVARGDVSAWDKIKTDLTLGAWTTWDCSAIVPAGATAILLRVQCTSTVTQKWFGARDLGNTHEYTIFSICTVLQNTSHEISGVVPCDSDRKIQYFADSTLAQWTSLNMVIVGWFI